MEQAKAPHPGAIDELVQTCSNWGRWGEADERGTLNLLVPAVRLQALSVPRSGETVSLSRPLVPKASLDNPSPLLHHMVRSGLEADPCGFSSATDWIGLSFHGFGTTHLDALAHVFWRRRMYNDRGSEEVSEIRRCRFNGIDKVVDGIVARGVLFDAPRALGVQWLEPGEGLTPEDLDRCEEQSGVTVAPGDVLLVRTGRDARASEMGVHEPLRDGNPGLLPACAAWLHERDVAVLGSDVVSDVMVPGAAPHLMPIHVAALVAMGMPLLDNASLDRLAERCAAVGRWSFLFLATPLSLVRGTGSPVNPLAVL